MLKNDMFRIAECIVGRKSRSFLRLSKRKKLWRYMKHSSCWRRKTYLTFIQC